MVEQEESFLWEKDSKYLRWNAHKIKGLQDFAYYKIKKATCPIGSHVHKNDLEFHVVVDGVRYRKVNNEVYTICANEVFVTFPNEIHGGATGKDDPCEWYSFQIDLSAPENLLGLGRKSSLQLAAVLRGLECRHFKIEPFQVRQLKECLLYLGKRNEKDLRKAMTFLCCFLFCLPEYTPITDENSHMSTDDENIQRVLDYIALHLRENLHLKMLAEVSGYSLSHFEMVFKKKIGITPSDYITYQRINSAKALLENTELSITAVALECGFSTSNYFCSVFKKMVNCTPRQYRVQHLMGKN